MATLTSTATFTIADAATALAAVTVSVYPAWPVQSGHGRIVHPTFGAFDYEVKPDEWVNLDGDVFIPPVWASTKTMVGAANVLWPGSIRDVVCEERWKGQGGLTMPATMLRMLALIWTNPVDPAIGYVTWYPNYISGFGYQVLPVSLTVGGQGIVSDDVMNYIDADGTPDGWVTNPVTFMLKLVGKL